MLRSLPVLEAGRLLGANGRANPCWLVLWNIQSVGSHTCLEEAKSCRNRAHPPVWRKYSHVRLWPAARENAPRGRARAQPALPI